MNGRKTPTRLPVGKRTGWTAVGCKLEPGYLRTCSGIHIHKHNTITARTSAPLSHTKKPLKIATRCTKLSNSLVAALPAGPGTGVGAVLGWTDPRWAAFSARAASRSWWTTSGLGSCGGLAGGWRLMGGGGEKEVQSRSNHNTMCLTAASLSVQCCCQRPS